MTEPTLTLSSSGVNTQENQSCWGAPWLFRAAKKIIPEKWDTIVEKVNCRSNSTPAAKTSMMNKASGVVRSSDMFGFSPIVKFDSYQTTFGGICTLICLTGILIYMVVTSVRFLDSSISKSQVIVNADSIGLSVPMVGVQFNQANGEPFSNSSWINFFMEIDIIYNSDIVNNKTTTHLNLTLCDYYTNISMDYQPFSYNNVPVYTGITCVDLENNTFPGLDQLGNLVGIFEDKKFRYLQVTLNTCVGTSPDGNPCENSTLIQNMISGGEIVIMWYNVGVDDVIGVDPHLISVRDWKSYRFKFATGLVVSKDLYLQKDSITHHSAWPLGKIDQAVAFRESKMIDTFTTYSPNNGRYFKVIFRTDELMIQEDWTAQLLFDLLGSWGAFWSVLLLIIGSTALVYNSKKWEFLVEENKLNIAGSDTRILNVLEQRLGRNSANQDDLDPKLKRKKSLADMLNMSHYVHEMEEKIPVSFKKNEAVDLP